MNQKFSNQNTKFSRSELIMGCKEEDEKRGRRKRRGSWKRRRGREKEEFKKESRMNNRKWKD